MEVAPRSKLFALLTMLTWFTLWTWFTLLTQLILFKLLYMLKQLHVCLYTVWKGKNPTTDLFKCIRSPCW